MEEKSITITYKELSTPEDLATALATALDYGWRGTVTAFTAPVDNTPGAELEDVWALELSPPDNGGKSITATLGYVLVWDGVQFHTLTEDAFEKRYGSKEPPPKPPRGPKFEDGVVLEAEAPTKAGIRVS